jgi:type II secretory pathway pseudopilin PulG
VGRRGRSWLCRRLRPGAGEDGFILIESMIAITVITIVMSAVGAEFVGGMIASSQQRAQQVAVQMADSTMEQIQSLDPSDLVTGRGTTSVGTQFTAGIGVPAIKRGLCRRPITASACDAFMDNATDPAVATGSGSTAAVPTTPSTTVAGSGSVGYTVNQYLGWCSVLKTVASPALSDCVRSSTSTLTADNSTKYLRAVVSVAWNGPRCLTTCAYVTSTLLSAAADPTFRINAGAYAAPVVLAKADQSNVINDTNVSVAMSVQNGTGVPPFTWSVPAGALPNGLVLNPATGVISTSPPGPLGGAVQGPAGTYNATIKVTDAFLRTDTQPLAWTVKPALVLTKPASQVTVVNQPTSLALAATGGDGPPYTFSIVSGLPPGLGISPSTGVIAGTPTQVGVYTVTAKVFDVTNTRFDTKDFTWTVSHPPIAAATPSAQLDTLNNPIKGFLLSASGASGSYVWSDPTGSLPAGLTVSPAGLLAGTPSTLTSGSGKPVTLTVSDPTAGPGYTTTVTFTWTVLPRPTVSAPATPIVYTVGQQVALGFTTACPNGPCTYALNNGPTGLSVTSAGIIGGAATTVGISSNATITVTDSDGAATSTAPFTITVKDKPSVAGATRTDVLGDVVSVTLTTACPNASCSYVLTNGPPGLSVNSSGVVTGTIGGSATTYGNVTSTVTDAGGISVTSGAFSWTVKPSLALATPPSQASVVNQGTSPLTLVATGGDGAPYTFSVVSGLPPGLSLAPATGVISGTPTTVGTYTVVVKVVDRTTSRSSTASFSWVVGHPPIVASNPGAQRDTLGTAIAAVQLTASGGSGTYTWSDPTSSLPAGLTVSTGGRVTGTPSALAAAKSVSLTVTDSSGLTTAVTFTWTIVAQPTVTSPGNRTLTLGQTVSLALTTSCPNTPCTYVLSNGPAGLSVSATGTIGGTVGGIATTYPNATIRVTDSDGATATTPVFTITVKDKPTVATPASRTDSVGDTVNLQVASTCPNAPCSYDINNAPTGLSIDGSGLIAGRIGGASKVYSGVTVTVTDTSGVSVTSGGFTWTITYRAIAVSNPGRQVDTLTTAIPPLQLTASGGSGNYVWTASAAAPLPAGLTISGSGLVTGTPTATNGTGTSVTLTVTDPTAGAAYTGAVTFVWNIVARPTVTSPGNRANTVGTNASVQLATTCPNTPCVYGFGGSPPGTLTISSTGLITGPVGTTAGAVSGLTVVVTDADGATATSAAFSWTVNAAPTMGSPGNQTTLRNAAVSLNMSAYDRLGTSPYTFSATNLPTWLTINASTGVVTGTAPNTNSVTQNITVTVTDGSGVTATSPIFRWNVTDLANSFGDLTTYNSSPISKDLDTTGSGGTSPYTYTETGTGLPSWLILSSTTGVISGNAPDVTNNSVKYGPITLNMFDTVGASITLNDFYWYNSDLRTIATLTKSSSKNSSVTGSSFGPVYIGGGTTKTYSATGLPPGVTINSTGTLTGNTPNIRTTYTVILTATDSVGATLTASIAWTLT